MQQNNKQINKVFFIFKYLSVSFFENKLFKKFIINFKNYS